MENVPLPIPESKGATLSEAAGELPADMAGDIDQSLLAVIAIRSNPQLKALRIRERVADAQIFAAGLLPDPGGTAGFDEPLDGVGLFTAVAASLSFDFASLLRRPFAVRAAEANLDAVRFDIAWAEWLTAQNTRLLATQVFYLGKIKSLTREFRGLADEELTRAMHSVARGDLAPAALETRRLAVTDAANRDRAAESLWQTAKLGLNRSLGIEPSLEFSVAAPPPLGLPVSEPPDLFERAVERRADLAGLRAGYEGSRAALDATVLLSYPLPAVGLNFARDTSDVHTLGPNVSLTLPVWNRGRGERAIAEANRAQLHAEYVARTEMIRADIAQAHAILHIAIKQHAEVLAEIEPLAAQAKATNRAAGRGDLPLSIAVSARMALLDRQIVAVNLAQAVAELAIALELASGHQLESIDGS